MSDQTQPKEIEQLVQFMGGIMDGSMAPCVFKQGFQVGCVIDVAEGIRYKVRKGPIAQAVEKTQMSIAFAAVVAVPCDEEDEDYRMMPIRRIVDVDAQSE